MTFSIRGPFTVTMTPEHSDAGDGSTLARMALRKTYSGDLSADSTGTFLSAMSAVQGSAGYVAIERVTGTLAGRIGSFALQHSGTMQRGTAALSITVVPDSGSGQLTGLSGCMRIVIEDGAHFYEFEGTVEE